MVGPPGLEPGTKGVGGVNKNYRTLGQLHAHGPFVLTPAWPLTTEVGQWKMPRISVANDQ